MLNNYRELLSSGSIFWLEAVRRRCTTHASFIQPKCNDKELYR